MISTVTTRNGRTQAASGVALFRRVVAGRGGDCYNALRSDDWLFLSFSNSKSTEHPTMTAILERPVRLETGDARLYEVVYGQIKEKTVGTRQNLIACRIACLIGQFDAGRQLGHPVIENLFVLDAASDLKRRPDFAFVARQQWSGLPPDTNAWDVVPDWLVEIISPSNSADEVIEKVDEYFRAGTRLVWVIYPNSQRVYVYTSPTDVTIYETSDELTAEPVLPAFRLQTDALFEGIAVSAAPKP